MNLLRVYRLFRKAYRLTLIQESIEATKNKKIELVRAIFNMIVCNVALHTCGGRAFLRNNSTTAISVTVTCIIFRYSCDTR